MALELIVEDVYSNFEAYKVTKDEVPHCKVVL